MNKERAKELMKEESIGIKTCFGPSKGDPYKLSKNKTIIEFGPNAGKIPSCNHNWATYKIDTSEMTITQTLKNEQLIHQVCAKCNKKRIGYPQPIKWEEEE